MPVFYLIPIRKLAKAQKITYICHILQMNKRSKNLANDTQMVKDRAVYNMSSPCKKNII
jgi:hypothetical protein